MTELVVRTSGLRKVYRARGRRVVAVDGLALEVPRGGVHGFLGPNGSGKTTTLRILLGLARPTSGEAHVLGKQVPDGLVDVLARVGAVVEEPKFLPSFSGRKNLLLLARARGLHRASVDDAIRRVGLWDRRRDSFDSYSLGMRQRLAIASALMHRPELLVLDEPTNGLDPAGIRDIRNLVRELGDAGVSVLLSSHNLAEVQQVCDSVSIIGEGRLLASGTVEGLLGENVFRTRVGVADADAAADRLREAGRTVTVDDRGLLVDGHEHPEEITRLLAEHGVYVRELGVVRPSLEAVFLRLTGDDRPGGSAPPPAAQVAVPAGEEPGDDMDESDEVSRS